MSTLRLFAFGPPRLIRGGEPLDISLRKDLALLVYLAVTRQPHSRDALATLLWPDSDQQAGRSNLRRALYRLNKQFQSDVLCATTKTIELDPDAGLWVDVEAYEDHVAACLPHDKTASVSEECLSRLAEAVELYTDDFLAGFTLPDSPTFDEWQFFQTEGLRQSLAEVLECLVVTHRHRDEFDRAIPYARRRLVLDPLHEPAHRDLMQLYAWTNQRAAALRQYEECERLLDEEFGAAPEDKTITLYEAIRTNRLELPERSARPEPASSPTMSSAAVETAPHSSLPTQPTPFIGRETELAEVRRLLLDDPECRLLTLVGPGGIGKTRLSLAVASSSQDAFRDGVYFASLAPVTEPAHIVPTIADALGLNFSGSKEPRTQLLDHLHAKHLLLVIDNVEHLLDEASLFSSLLRAAPNVTLLVTSRERLNVQEEWVYEVRGLPFPQGSDDSNTADQYGAVRLFVERARHADAGFSPSREDVAQIVRVCRLVDGMPLALELAAPWVRVMSCEAIAGELEKSLDLLTTTMRNVPARHRSVRAVFEQTWVQLRDAERDVLRSLSVFRGGCSRDATSDVAGATLPLLASLIDKALLRRDSRGRYQMHEVIRQFALEQLQQDQDVYERVHDRHCYYYIDFLAGHTAGLKMGRQNEAFSEIGTDIDNVRVAWRHAVSHGYAEAIEKAAECLWLFGEFRGTLHQSESAFRQAADEFIGTTDGLSSDERQQLVGFLRAAEGYMRARRGDIDDGRSLMEQGLSQLQQSTTYDTHKEATILQQLSFILLLHGRFIDAKHRGEMALERFSTAGDRAGVANSLLIIGASEQFLGRFQRAETVLRECLSICREIGAFYIRVHVDQLLARTAIVRGQYSRARELLDDAMTVVQSFSDLWLVGAYTAREYGWLDVIEGKYTLAEERLRESVALFQESGSQWEAGDSLGYLGTAVHFQGRFDEAEALYLESLAAANVVGHPMNRANALTRLGCLAADRGKYPKAHHLFREAQAIWTEIGNEPELASVLRHLGHVSAVPSEGDEHAARVYYAQSLELATQHKLSPLALDIFVGVAGLLARAGQTEQAIELLGLAEHHAGSTHETRRKARAHLDALATELPDDEVAKRTSRGHTLDWHQAAIRFVETHLRSNSE